MILEGRLICICGVTNWRFNIAPSENRSGMVDHLPQRHDYIHHAHEVAAGQRLLSVAGGHEILIQDALTLAQFAIDHMLVTLRVIAARRWS